LELRAILVVLLGLYGALLLVLAALGLLWFDGVLLVTFYGGAPWPIRWLVTVSSTSGALLIRACVTFYAARSLWRGYWKQGGLATSAVIVHQLLAFLPSYLYRP
jgi:hypothetical protein